MILVNRIDDNFVTILLDRVLEKFQETLAKNAYDLWAEAKINERWVVNAIKLN